MGTLLDNPCLLFNLARDSPHTRCLVRLTIIIRTTARAIDHNLNTRVSTLVRARERLRLTSLKATSTGDLNLRTAAVELSAASRVGGVKGQELPSEKVLAGGDAGGEGEVPPAVLGEEGVDAPGVGGGVEVLLGDLEPVAVGVGVGSGVVDGGEPGCDGTLVACCLESVHLRCWEV